MINHEQMPLHSEEAVLTVENDSWKNKEKIPFCSWCPPDLKPAIDPAIQTYSGSICEKHSSILLARAELKRIERRNSAESTPTEIQPESEHRLTFHIPNVHSRRVRKAQERKLSKTPAVR